MWICVVRFSAGHGCLTLIALCCLSGFLQDRSWCLTLRILFRLTGFLLDKKVGVNQPKRMEKCKILIANTPMDTDKVKVGTSIIAVIVLVFLSFLFVVVVSPCKLSRDQTALADYAFTTKADWLTDQTVLAEYAFTTTKADWLTDQNMPSLLLRLTGSQTRICLHYY